MTDPLSNFEEIDCRHHFSSDDLSGDQNKRLCFDPPLYIQRYNYVSGLLFDFKCKSVMDIGCAECKLIHLLKQTNQNLNLIIGLDLDESVLEKNKSKFSDNLVDMFHCRENPLDMYLVKGDISKPDKYFLDKFCSKSCGLDFVSMVEIIEHMYPEALQGAIETVFMQLRPKYVLISTPNSEFNVVFGENSNPYDERKIDQKFRHWDHKFEWTRDEFRKWCREKILDVYQDYKLYNNSFHGLGEPPREFEKVGHCTQMALFYNQELIDCSSNSILNQFQAYLKEKKNIYLKNRYRNPQEEPIRQNLYFNPENAKQNGADKATLIHSFSYPFELREFDSDEERNRVMIDEINYLVSFLTQTSNYQRHSAPKHSDPNDLASHLTEEEKEKIDNDIDIYDDSIKLAKLDTLLNFSSIKKFAVSGDQIVDLMKKVGYKFTKKDKFVIHVVQTESESEDFSEHEDANDELNSIESRRRETDFFVGKADEQFDIDNSLTEDKDLTKSNDAFNFGEENWDQYLPQVSEMPNLKYKESLSEQFQNAEDTNFSHSEEYIQKCLNFEFKSRRNRLRLTDFASCNYNADKQKKYAYNLRAIRKRNRRIEETPSIGQFSLD